MEAFEEIFTKNYDKVYAFLLRLCGDGHLAEELTQETFFQAFSGIHRFKGDCEVFTWLAAIGKHTYYKHLRKIKCGLEAVSLDTLTDAYCLTSGNPTEDELIRKSVVQAVRRIIDRIPDKYRDVVILRIYGELPFSQVAKALDITEGSAKTIYCRAKKMLMEEMNNDFEL